MGWYKYSFGKIIPTSQMQHNYLKYLKNIFILIKITMNRLRLRLQDNIANALIKQIHINYLKH